MGSLEYFMVSGFPKSFQLSHKCPLVDAHSSCDFPDKTSHDCLCKTMDFLFDNPVIDKKLERPRNDECGLIHLTTVQQNTMNWNFWGRNKYRKKIWQIVRNNMSELSIMAREMRKKGL